MSPNGQPLISLLREIVAVCFKNHTKHNTVGPKERNMAVTCGRLILLSSSRKLICKGRGGGCDAVLHFALVTKVDGQ